MADLEESIRINRQALATIEANNPARASFLVNLGAALATHYASTNHSPDASQAMAAFREASSIETAPAFVRLRAAAALGRLAASREAGSPEAFQGYQTAVSMLPVLAWRGLDRMSRERLIAEFPLLASDAAASSIAADKPALAIELLEQGRGPLVAATRNPIRPCRARRHRPRDGAATAGTTQHPRYRRGARSVSARVGGPHLSTPRRPGCCWPAASRPAGLRPDDAAVGTRPRADGPGPGRDADHGAPGPGAVPLRCHPRPAQSPLARRRPNPPPICLHPAPPPPGPAPPPSNRPNCPVLYRRRECRLHR
jgi:hypothetical protein